MRVNIYMERGLTPEHGVKIIITILTQHIKSQVYAVQIQAYSLTTRCLFPQLRLII